MRNLWSFLIGKSRDDGGTTLLKKPWFEESVTLKAGDRVHLVLQGPWDVPSLSLRIGENETRNVIGFVLSPPSSHLIYLVSDKSQADRYAANVKAALQPYGADVVRGWFG